MLMICPKSGIEKDTCNRCSHHLKHNETTKCHGTTCGAVKNGEIVNCESEIKFSRIKKLKKINDNITDTGRNIC